MLRAVTSHPSGIPDPSVACVLSLGMVASSPCRATTTPIAYLLHGRVIQHVSGYPLPLVSPRRMGKKVAQDPLSSCWLPRPPRIVVTFERTVFGVTNCVGHLREPSRPVGRQSQTRLVVSPCAIGLIPRATKGVDATTRRHNAAYLSILAIGHVRTLVTSGKSVQCRIQSILCDSG